MVWEILILAEKNKLGAVQSIQTLIRKGIDDLKLFEASLNTEIAFLSRSLRLPHQDRADRFIVATAAHYDMTLLTADERILRSGACKTIAACE
jgi:PIN domain nuclease of toxin-antitoxin system